MSPFASLLFALGGHEHSPFAVPKKKKRRNKRKERKNKQKRRPTKVASSPLQFAAERQELAEHPTSVASDPQHRPQRSALLARSPAAPVE